MTGRDHALDRHRTLGDEQFVTLDPTPGDGVLELAIVGEPGIVGVLDPLRQRPSLRRRVDRVTMRIRANIERMFWQGSLFGLCARSSTSEFADVRREQLDATSWVDHAPRWLRGSDQLLDELVAVLPLRQRTGVRMYDRIVSEPRLSAWWQEQHGRPEPLPMLRDMRLVLAEQLRRAVRFDRLQPVPRRRTTRSHGTPTATPRSSPIRSSRSSASARHGRSGCARRAAVTRACGSSVTATCS